MSAIPVFYNVDKWIEANKNDFVPPVCNRMMHDNQLKVFYVGGPNQRKDFHIEEGDEFFYMLKGDMVLRVQEKGQFRDIQIKEGEVFLLPSRIPHSPQRTADTIGMVIERERKPTEQDCIRWFVEDTTTILYDYWVHVEHLGTQVASAIRTFQESEERKTGRPGIRSKHQPFMPDCKRTLSEPFSLKQWILNNKTEISSKGYKSMFDNTFQTQVTVYGAGEQTGSTSLFEIFVMQLDGSRVFTIHNKQYRLDEGDTLLISKDVSYHSTGSNNSYSLFVQMETCKKSVM